MKHITILTVFALALASFVTGAPVAAQEDDARKERILANLEHQIPQLGQVNASIGDIEPTDIEGLEQGTLVIDGQPRPFLITSDDTKLWLLAGEAVDVSRSAEEIQADQAQQEAERTETLAQAIEGDPVRGNPDAPVTIIEYSDFQCPYCARGFETMEQVLEKYPDDVKFVFQHFPLTRIHPWAKPASIAAVCAADQDENAFWTLHDAYFENQDDFNVDNVVEKSKEILADSGIDLATWETCAGDENSEAYQAAETKVEDDLAQGQELGVSGTPGFFVNGEFLNGAQPISAFEPLIEEATGGSGGGASDTGE
ncbi:MAG: thioredoxin domain-containing protein [Thermoanaerobaculia bacterium]